MRSRWLGFVVVALLLGVSLWAYPQLPAMAASHWNLRGEVNGYAPRWVAAFLVPAVLLVGRALVTLLPRIDPLGKNYARFTDTFWVVVNSSFICLGLVHLATLASALGYAVNVGRIAPLGMGLLLMMLGNVLGRIEPNWFMGIRTPWTLSSEHVWRKTHRVGAWVFVGVGVVVSATSLIPGGIRLPLLLGLLGVVAAIPVVYSYYIWKAEQHVASR